MRRYALASAASLACFAMALVVLKMPLEPPAPSTPNPGVQFIQIPSSPDVHPSTLLYEPDCYLVISI